MKRAPLIIVCLFLLVNFGFSAVKAGSNDITVPDMYTVESEYVRLTAANTGIYGGGLIYGSQYGLFFRPTMQNPPDHKTGAYALHSNPGGIIPAYGDNWRSTVAMSNWVQLSGYASYTLSYWAHWNIEPDFDGVELEIAKDGDESVWYSLHPGGTVPGDPSGTAGQPDPSHYYYEGSQGAYNTYTQYTCDLTAYAGKNIKLRFNLRSDPSIHYKGFFVDDLLISGPGAGQTVYSCGWELSDPEWVNGTSGFWGKTQAETYTDSMMFMGEFLAGTSASYVANGYPSADMQSFGVWPGPPLHIRTTNRWTAPSGQPKIDVDTYFYAPSGTGAGTFIVVDSYVKNAGDTPISNLYLATNHSPYVDIPGDEWAGWDPISTHKMVYVFDGLQTNNNGVGIIFLKPAESPDVNAVNINPLGYWGQDAALWGCMTGGIIPHTFEQEGRWYVVLGSGPYPTIPRSGVARFSFAYTAATSINALGQNAAACQSWYGDGSNIRIPYTKVVPRSLGTLKAMYKD